MVAKLTGMAKSDMVGQHLSTVVSDTIYPQLEGLLRAAIDGETSRPLEITLLRKPSAASLPPSSGARERGVDLLLSATARRDPSGLCVGVVFLGQDVTSTTVARGKQQQLDVQMQQVLCTSSLAAHSSH